MHRDWTTIFAPPGRRLPEPVVIKGLAARSRSLPLVETLAAGLRRPAHRVEPHLSKRWCAPIVHAWVESAGLAAVPSVWLSLGRWPAGHDDWSVPWGSSTRSAKAPSALLPVAKHLRMVTVIDLLLHN